MKNFNDSVAKEYEQDIRKKILGYDVMQNLITILINHELPLNSSILVVGCGTGEEIVRLEKLSSSYQIIGIDPSQDMLSLSRNKVKSELVCTSLENYERSEKFNCVLSILVSHLIKKGDPKNNFFSCISNKLKKGGLFIGVDYMDLGLNKFQNKIFQEKIDTTFHPITESVLESVLNQNGFDKVIYFFNSLGFKGYFTKKNE